MTDHMYCGFDPQIWAEAIVAKFISIPHLTLSVPDFLIKEPKERKIQFAKKWNKWYDETSHYYDIKKNKIWKFGKKMFNIII